MARCVALGLFAGFKKGLQVMALEKRKRPPNLCIRQPLLMPDGFSYLPAIWLACVTSVANSATSGSLGSSVAN